MSSVNVQRRRLNKCEEDHANVSVSK